MAARRTGTLVPGQSRYFSGHVGSRAYPISYTNGMRNGPPQVKRPERGANYIISNIFKNKKNSISILLYMIMVRFFG